MSKPYLEQIDDLLAMHRREIERLEIAKQVLVSLGTSNGAKQHAAEATAEKPFLTIRRVDSPAPAAKASKKKSGGGSTRSPERKAEKAAIRERVVEALKEEPQTSTTLIGKFLPADASKNEKQKIYDALYILKQSGTLTRGEDARYSVVTSH